MPLPARLLHRRSDSHKYDYGHLLVIAGSPCFSGAGLLCAEAALRCGAGLVTLAVPESLHGAIVRAKLKEVMTLPLPDTAEGSFSRSAAGRLLSFSRGTDAVVIGPGLSRAPSTQQLVRSLIGKVRKPCVIDADALYALSGHLSALRSRTRYDRMVLTPHEGEFSRLSGVAETRIRSDRKRVAKEFARHYNVTLVLKGHRTVVASADGALYVNKTGNPGMATAGSGDVLAGVIAAFIGQGLNLFDASRYGVYLHGMAGDLAAKKMTQLSMIASDIIEQLPRAVKRCSRHS